VEVFSDAKELVFQGLSVFWWGGRTDGQL